MRFDLSILKCGQIESSGTEWESQHDEVEVKIVRKKPTKLNKKKRRIASNRFRIMSYSNTNNSVHQFDPIVEMRQRKHSRTRRLSNAAVPRKKSVGFDLDEASTRRPRVCSNFWRLVSF